MRIKKIAGDKSLATQKSMLSEWKGTEYAMQQISAKQISLDLYEPIFPARLDWLCQPDQIEDTLRLLYALQGWKQANQHLLYADRQGLQEVQALVLARATLLGAVQPVTYIDGTRRFPGELLESAAEEAARGVLVHLQGLNDPDIWPPFCPDGDTIYKRWIRPLLRRITGQDFKLVADAQGVLPQARLRDYIQVHLHRLVERASKTRKPLPLRSLANLCIAPVDLLRIRDNRVSFLDGYDTWGDLDESDLCKLDPEGYSEVAFQYSSPSAKYVFHLPFWRAAEFVPAERLRELQHAPGTSQPYGICQGKVLDEMEGLIRPASEILQDLGVDIISVCPHTLLAKAVYLDRPGIRELLWPRCGHDHDDWENDPWDGLCLPRELA